ncbi:anthranilate phosphoribosyltransferase [Calditrichota bacterium LG25]
MKRLLEKIADRQNLTRAEAREALQAVIDERITAAQAGALLMGLRQKGESVDEINGFLDVLNEHKVQVYLKDAQAVDVCGTGGDGKGTFNISTAVGFVLAAGGVTVAKHGNRSISSKAGSADVLEALGVNINLTPEQAKKCADEIQFTFFFAPHYHPAMKKIGPHRKSLNIRTVFNLLGPLLNPANVRRQLIGAFNPQAAEIMAQVLLERGHEHAYVVHARDGLDEVSPFSKTIIHEVKQGERQIKRFEFNGFEASGPFSDIAGQSAEENAEKILQIFNRKRGADRDVVVLNSAFAFKAAGRVSDIDEGIALARETIDSGQVIKKLAQFVEMSHSFN